MLRSRSIKLGPTWPDGNEGEDQMSMDRENLEGNLYICYRDNAFECTNFQHARGYLFLYSREEEADQEGFCNATEEDLLEVIKEMGFKRCGDGNEEDCIKWKLVDRPVCFKRRCGYRRKKGKRNALIVLSVIIIP